ncbi:hypothetical protein [Niallia sp. FSL R7-0271]|uniref:hypothetical protein n=1 Tax=Niallia sp. FSL R7-0271 TaxID=2921678 RepID=UPI0030F8254F
MGFIILLVTVLKSIKIGGLFIKKLIVFFIVLLIGGGFYMFKKNTTSNSYEESPLAAGMNFDFEQVEPLLNRINSSVLDSGFSQSDINYIQSEIELMIHNEVKEIGTFNVVYNEKKTKIRIEAEVHSDENPPDVVLYMYSTQELVDLLDEAMMEHAEDLGV